MTSTERARLRRRRHVLAVAPVLLAGLTSCAANQPAPKPATPGALSERDVIKLRSLDPTPRATPRPRAKRVVKPTPTRISTATHITIPPIWAALVQCEASGHWAYGKPGGYVDPGYANYEGGPNFVHSTWTAYKPDSYPLHAYDATPLQQIVVAKRVLKDQGVRAWPVCGPRVGLRLSDAA